MNVLESLSTEGLLPLKEKSPHELAHLFHTFNQAIDVNIIASITDKRGKITYANKKFCEISQYSKEELIGQDHRLLNSNYHPKAFFTHMWKTIADGKVWHDEVRNRKKDGTFYWVETTIVPVFDTEGQIKQYLSLRVVIDEKKKLLQHEEQIKVLEEILFKISHEVRHPVSNILGLSNLIETGSTSPEELKEIVEYIKTSALSLDAFTKDLTRFIHEIKANKSPSQLAEVSFS